MRCFSRIAVPVFGLIAIVCQPALAADNSAMASAGKQVHSTQMALDHARAVLNQIRAKVRTELASQPQWSSAMKELRDSQTALEKARRTALAGLVKDAAYQQLVRERADSQAVLSAANQSDAQIQKAGDLFMQQGFAIKQRESEVLAKDENYTQAKSRFGEARVKADGLDQAASLAMKSDPEYEPAMQHLDAAEQQLKSARGQLAQAVQAERQQALDKARADAQQGATGN